MTPSGDGRSPRDLVAAGGLAAAAACVWLETAGYPGSLVSGAPGPAFFPRLLALLAAGLALLLAWRAWRGTSTAGRDVSRPEARRVGASLLLLVLFVALLPRVGAFLLLPPLLASVMLLMGERSWLALAGVPLLFDLFVYLVFYRFFSVDLPTVLF